MTLFFATENDLYALQVILDAEIPATTQASQPDMNAQLANMVTAVQSIANAPVVPLPKFSGKITHYAGFKKNFQNLIQKVAGPKTLWASHLVNALKGDAQKYIGESNKWFDNYDKLWDNLDAKYGNRWILAAESVKALFNKLPPPADDLEAVKAHFFELIDALIALMELGMSLEEVGVNFIIETLPDEHKTDLRNGLRALQPGQKTASFKIDTVRNVFNDTIGVKTENEPAPLKGTLSLQTHQTLNTPKPPQVSQMQTQASSHQPEPPSSGRGGRGRSRGQGPSYSTGATGTGSPYGGNQGYAGHSGYSRGSFYNRGQAPGRGAGYGGSYQFRNDNYNSANQTPYRDSSNNTGQGRGVWCSLCIGPYSLTHPTFQCTVYQTPAEKRQRLWNLDLCCDCARPRHNGECSYSIRECGIHLGVRHYRWLCDASQQPQSQQSQYPQTLSQQSQYQQLQSQPSQYQQQQFQQPQFQPPLTQQQYQQNHQIQHQGGQA